MANRVVWLSLAGSELDAPPLVMQSYADLIRPGSIVQCAGPDDDIVVMATCQGADNWSRLVKFGFRSGVVETVDMAALADSVDGRCSSVFDFASLPEGGLVALDARASCFRVFTSLTPRTRWIKLAVSWQRRR